MRKKGKKRKTKKNPLTRGAANKNPKKRKRRKEERKEEPAKPMQIDLAGLSARIVAVPMHPGILSGLAARKDKLFYVDTPQEALEFVPNTPPRPRNVLHLFDMTKRSEERRVGKKRRQSDLAG